MKNTFQWPWAEIQPASRPPLARGLRRGLVQLRGPAGLSGVPRF
jgi:hypothetical protein